MKDPCEVGVPSDDEEHDWDEEAAVEVAGSQATAANRTEDYEPDWGEEAAVEVGGSPPTAADRTENDEPDWGEAQSDEPGDGHTLAQLRRGVGSQPTEMVLTAVGDDGPPVHIGIANRVYLYEEDAAVWQMLDGDLLQKLRSDATPGYWYRKTRGGKRHKYWVDPGAMLTTNFKTQTNRRMKSLFMLEVPLQSLSATQQTTTMGLLADDGWSFAWQVADNNGWKNMGLAANDRLLDAWAQKQFDVDIEHEWKDPNNGTWKTSMYDVDIQRMQQKSRQGRQTERTVRLVAFADHGGASGSNTT